MGTKGDTGVAPIFLCSPQSESVDPRETQGQNVTKPGINMLSKVVMPTSQPPVSYTS